MRIDRLLQLEDQYAFAEGLSDSIGDRYLFSNNPVFRRIRQLSITHGAVFTTGDSDLWRDYDCAPLLMLNDIIALGTIPYRSNANTLRRALARCPTFELPTQLFLSVFRRNVVLHESAHYLSRRILDESLRGREPGYINCLTALLGEAYANVIERLADLCGTSADHRLFLALNSYCPVADVGNVLLRGAIRSLGVREVVFIGLLTYLHLNLCPGSLTEQTRTQILELSQSGVLRTAAERALAEGMMASTFTLNKAFREETIPMFFKYTGCDREYERIRRLGFQPSVLWSTGIDEAINRLVDIIAEPACDHEIQHRAGLVL